LWLLISAIVLVSAASISHSKPFRMTIIPDSGRKLGCSACHVSLRGGGKLNPFGKDYAKYGVAAGEKYTGELDKLDSDKDGFTNGQEFKSNTHPGDAESKPASREPSL